MVIRSPRLTIRQDVFEAGISKSSYQIAMKQLGFKPYHPTLVVGLNEDDFDRRSEFCEIWLEKFENNHDLVDLIFGSDEAAFRMNTTVNRHNCTYWARENPHLRFEVPNMKEGVMVWCGMTSNGLVEPYFFNDTVTGPLYKEMLVKRGPFDWPARSPDLTPCDFFLWGYLKDIVFQNPPATIIELKQRIEEA
ncbi:unnamed protein product, partial [Rotaria sp. Silwood1]